MTSRPFPPRTPRQAASVHVVGSVSTHDAAPRQNGLRPRPEAAPCDAPNNAHLDIEVEDWDVLFEAVKTTLRRTVGERLDPPRVPTRSAALSASLVQAVVLDCAHSLDRLHAALQRERSQRPTP